MIIILLLLLKKTTCWMSLLSKPIRYRVSVSWWVNMLWLIRNSSVGVPPGTGLRNTQSTNDGEVCRSKHHSSQTSSLDSSKRVSGNSFLVTVGLSVQGRWDQTLTWLKSHTTLCSHNITLRTLHDVNYSQAKLSFKRVCVKTNEQFSFTEGLSVS